MGNEPLFIGVVTVTFNSADVLEEFVASLCSQEFGDFRVYAVDNASKDASADYLSSVTVKSRNINVTRNSDNLGVAEANNQGIQLAIKDGCSHVLLLNNDTAFPPTLFGKLVETSKRGLHEAVVPKIYRYLPKNILWYAGGRFNRLFGYSAIHFGDGMLDDGTYDSAMMVEYAPTCCMLVKKETLNTVGPMDAKYFVYYDDIDFCFRLLNAGKTIRYEPNAVLFHKVGSTTGGPTSAFSARMGARNKIYFLRKNFSESRALITALAYFVYAVGRCLIMRDSFKILRVRIAALAEGFSILLH